MEHIQAKDNQLTFATKKALHFLNKQLQILQLVTNASITVLTNVC